MLKISGGLSSPFKGFRDIRQGCALGLDTGLFFMDYRKLQLNGVSSFYRGLF